MTISEYFQITDDAGNLYRSGNYEKSLNCCLEIVSNVDLIKKQMPDFYDANKDFISYSIMNLFKMGITNIGKEVFEGIIKSNIISPKKLKDDIVDDMEFEIESSNILENSDILKQILNYFKIVNIFNVKEESKYIKKIDESIKEWEEYYANREKIKSLVLKNLDDGIISQKLLYKKITEFDGRNILPIIKELEKEGIVKREKQTNDYIISKNCT